MPSPGLNFPNASRADFQLFREEKDPRPVAPAASMCRIFSLDCRCDAVKGEQVRESVAFKSL